MIDFWDNEEWKRLLRHRKIAYREGVRDGVMVGVVFTVMFAYIWVYFK